MTNNLDLNLLPVARYAGQDYSRLLGLQVAEPPRRAARGRAEDRLVLYLTITGNAPLPPGKQEKMLADLAKLFYDTPGSVTAALRAVADELNKLLLERNLNSPSNRQATGLFTQVVLRGQQLYLAQSGPVHAYLITANETIHFYDPGMVEHSLGQSRTTPLRFHQSLLQTNDTLLLASLPSPDWSVSAFDGLHGQGPETQRRRLFNQNETDLNAVLIQAKTGQGKFYLPRTAAAAAAPPVLTASQETEQAVMPASPGISAVHAAEFSAVAGAEMETPPIASPTEAAPAAPVSKPVISSPAFTPTPPVEPVATAEPPKRQPGLAPLRKGLAAAGVALAAFFTRLARGLRNFLGRMLPDESFLALPSSLMAIVAVIVPVVVVSAASAVYFRIGTATLYEELLKEAQRVAQRASEQTDLGARRSDLETSLNLLRQARRYGGDAPEIEEMRVQVRAALDEMELIRRVNYQPAIVGGLPTNVQVSRLVLSDNDLYMLDSSSGSVIRATLNGQVYVVDLTFQCGPGAAGATSSGKLIDVVPWPRDYEPKASVVAIDSQGFVLYCLPENPPTLDMLAAPTTAPWGNITVAALDGDFYVLDLPSNSVWFYRRSNFDEEPVPFFDQFVPDLQDIIDMAVDKTDLYLLHRSGTLTLCIYGFPGVTPSRCSDPNYIDFRLGHENLKLIPPTPFSQMQITQPPDPSLFMLEPKSQAVYHFSLRNLAFQRQYLPENPLPYGNVTAFTVDTIQRNLFLAIGNQVFYAVMP